MKHIHMKKFFSTFLVTTLLFSNIASANATSFSDVQDSSKNATAIQYLKDNGILSGYQDGSFKPDNPVNRAEFLKIILEGSGITTNVTANTPFQDIDNQAWYAPYVKKAYSSGWIIGYSDKTFRPDQTISKAEALKILGEVQNWQLPAQISTAPFTDVQPANWAAPYIFYAKEKGYTEETGSWFSPDQAMTRAKISEIIYRSLGNTTAIATENEESINETELENETGIDENFFDQIVLDQKLPETFYAGEVYVISGHSQEDTGEVTVILDGSNNTSYYKTFTRKTDNNNFEIPVHFKNSGNYILGIIPGTSGSSKASPIKVIATLPASSNTLSTPIGSNDFEIDFESDNTFVKINNNSQKTNTLKKLTFSQNNKTVTYFSRQNVDEISIDYADFENFNKGNTSYKLETAKINSISPLSIASTFSSSTPKNFNAGEHHYSHIDTEQISASIPETLNAPSKIKFSGKVLSNTSGKAYATKPNGLVEEFELSSEGQKIKKGDSFTFTYTPTTNGVYIIEINDENGFATVNHPVYIGPEIPLLPDFFDLEEKTLYKGKLDLQSARSELLNLINNDRKALGLNTVSLSEELNTLAQNHSEDMGKNNFLGHENLDGESPNDRRIRSGITTSVAENIAKDTSILSAHQGLMRSGAHRQNILDPEWERVGLGVYLKNGYLYITQEFSFNEYSTNDLQNMADELFGKINELRQENAVPTLNADDTLTSAAENLNDRTVNEGQSLTNATLSNIQNDYNIDGQLTAIVLTTSFWSQALDNALTKQDTLLESIWNSMGIDLELDNNGVINTTILLNNP